MRGALRIAIVAMLLAACLALTACSSLTYSVRIEAGGARTLVLQVDYDSDIDEATRAQITGFLQRVRDVRNANGRPCELAETDNYVRLTESFDSLTDYYVAMGITGDEEGEDTPYVDLNAYFVEYEVDMALATHATVLNYTLQYAVSAQADLLAQWRTYCEGRGNAVVGNALQSVYQGIAQSSDPLGATLTALDGEQGELMCADLEAWLAAKGYDLKDVPFHYSYEHVYKSVYAKDCSKQYRNSATGSMVYQWDMTLADVADADVTIYQKAPRIWVWELTAIAAAVATMGVILVIILIKRRKINNAASKAGEQ